MPINIAVILSAADKMSAVINAGTSKSIKYLNSVQAASDAISKKSFQFGKDMAVIGTAVGAPIAYATKQAIDFEDKMADVAKVYGTKIGSQKFLEMAEGAKELSVYLGRSAEEAAGLTAALGSGGVSEKELATIAKMAGEVGIAFDLTAELAGDRSTKLKNALGSSWGETKKVLDSINYLSDNQASKASEILDFMAAGAAGVASASKSSGQSMAGFGSALISFGKSGSEASTIMERFYKGIMKDKDSRSLFMNSGQGEEGFLAVLQKGASIKDSSKQFEFFQKFGEYGNDIRNMASKLDQVRGSVKSVGDATQYADSVQKEFLNRSSTTKGKIGVAWAEFNRIVLDFGQNGLPIITDFLKSMTPIVRVIGDFVKNNKELTVGIFKGMAAVAGFSLLMSGLSFGLGGVTKGISVFTEVIKWVPKIIGGLNFALFALRYHLVVSVWPALVSASTAVWGFTAALLANPITWVVVGIVALGAAIVVAWQKFEKFRGVVYGVFEVLKSLLSPMMAMVKAIFNPSLDNVKNAVSAFKNMDLGKSFTVGYDKGIKNFRDSNIPSTSQPGMASSIVPSAPKFGNSNSIANNSSSLKSSFTYAPVINIQGGTTPQGLSQILDTDKKKFERMMKEYSANQVRKTF